LRRHLDLPRRTSRAVALLAAGSIVGCSRSPTHALADAAGPASPSLNPLSAGSASSADGTTGVLDVAPSTWIDCVGALQVVVSRGYGVSNALRFGASNPSLRTAARIVDLDAGSLRAFCDWQACVRTNGYAHVCWVNDAGWERCRVCDGGADCDGLPTSQDDCVAQATGRAQCHVGLLEECLLQQAIRGPNDPRVTQSCVLSGEACAGQLPGDLTTQALAAQNETSQVTIEECAKELDAAAQLVPDANLSYWEQQLSMWDGGLPSDDEDAPSDDGPPGE
jgi:hypothetical protein